MRMDLNGGISAQNRYLAIANIEVSGTNRHFSTPQVDFQPRLSRIEPVARDRLTCPVTRVRNAELLLACFSISVEGSPYIVSEEPLLEPSAAADWRPLFDTYQWP
jgi:hypothetical protein